VRLFVDAVCHGRSAGGEVVGQHVREQCSSLRLLHNCSPTCVALLHTDMSTVLLSVINCSVPRSQCGGEVVCAAGQ
jgi:hypothetical protein